VQAAVHPTAVCVDQNGNVVIGPVISAQAKIRVLAERASTFYGVPMTAGDIYNVAGGLRGTRSDGGPAASPPRWTSARAPWRAES